MKYNYYLLLIDNQFLQLAKTLKLGRLIPSAEPNDIIFIAAIGEGGGIISPGIPFSYGLCIRVIFPVLWHCRIK